MSKLKRISGKGAVSILKNFGLEKFDKGVLGPKGHGKPGASTGKASKCILIFEKSVITTPIFGLFCLLKIFKTLINGHFQFLKE